jgi:endonuclease/exonuclease/phosphatase family metal-dependent hydrolase
VRQAQVRQLAAFIEEVTRRHDLGVVCGDFNAGPDSDELRMLTGRTDTAAPGLVFYDSWELAGDGTRSPRWACIRIAASTTSSPPGPGRAASATPHTARLLGAIRAPERLQLSDHYGVLADLRY